MCARLNRPPLQFASRREWSRPDSTTWPEFDPGALTARQRKSFIARRRAVELFAANCSLAELNVTLARNLVTYNHLFAQRAFKHQSPIQALRRWRADKPRIFGNSSEKQRGLDTQRQSAASLAMTQENGDVEAAEIDETLKHYLSTCNDQVPARTGASVTSSAALQVAK